MRRTVQFVALACCMLALAGCKDRDLRQQVQAWAHGGSYGGQTYEGVVNWQQKTFEVICDIYEKNTPDRADDTGAAAGNPTGGLTETSYLPITLAYCQDTEGNGKPDDPPPFGD